MNFIIDPTNLNKIPLSSYEGKMLLKKYIAYYQSGGVNRKRKINDITKNKLPYTTQLPDSKQMRTTNQIKQINKMMDKSGYSRTVNNRLLSTLFSKPDLDLYNNISSETSDNISSEKNDKIVIDVESMAGDKSLENIVFNPKDTIGVMKRKLIVLLRKNPKILRINPEIRYVFDVKFFNNKNNKLLDEDTNTLDTVYTEEDIQDKIIIRYFPNTENKLIGLLEAFPNKSWNWKRLSSNPNITIEYIEDAIKAQQKMIIEKKHEDPKFKWTMKQEILEWAWKDISSNPNLTMEFVEKHLDKPWDWGNSGISRNPNLTMEFIEKHPDKDWSWASISRNPNITKDIIEKDLEKPKNQQKPWSWRGISANPSITIKMIEDDLKKPQDLQKPWDWSGISANPNVTLKFIKNFLIDDPFDDDNRYNNLNLDCSGLASNSNLTIEFIEYIDSMVENKNNQWDWCCVSSNPNITMEMIEKDLEKPKNQQKPWNWVCISSNPNITMEMIKKDLEKSEDQQKPWVWSGISMNPNITNEFISTHKDINFRTLSSNKFGINWKTWDYY